MINLLNYQFRQNKGLPKETLITYTIKNETKPMQKTKHPILIRYLQDLKKGNGPNTANILGTINNVAVIDTADAVNIITPTRLKT